MTGAPTAVHVLHVDDEPAIADLTADYLEKRVTADYTVTTTTRPADAHDLLGANDVDCIVSDYDMPETDGIEFLTEVRHQYPDLPFILFTGKGSEEVAREAFQRGATDYVQKAVGSNQFTILSNRIQNAVAQYRATQTSRRYGTVIEALDKGVFVVDGDGELVSVNDIFVELTGLERRAVIGAHLSDLAATVGGDSLLQHYHSLKHGDETDTARFELEYGSGGDLGIYQVHLATRVATNGEFPGVIGTLHDVTDSRLDQDRIACRARLQGLVLDNSKMLMSARPDELATKVQWSVENLADLIDTDRCFVYTYDADEESLTRYCSWHDTGLNPGVEPITASDFVGLSWLYDRLRRFETVHVPDVADLPPDAAETKHHFTRRGTEAVLVAPIVSDWDLVGFLGYERAAEPVPWTDDEIDSIRTLADMIGFTFARVEREEELRRREASLAEKNQRLENFASVVSHDLRSPLNVAHGTVSFAAETGEIEHLDKASDALDRMEELIDEMLELTCDGDTLGETSVVNLKTVFARAWGHVDTCEADFTIADDVGRVDADAGRLQQAFENLIRNAVEHGGEDVHVTVGTTEEGFYVADDGPGVALENPARVFEHGHTTSAAGTGLGLAIVWRIVDAHGWTVSVSESADGGARFVIRTGNPTADAEDATATADD